MRAGVFPVADQPAVGQPGTVEDVDPVLAVEGVDERANELDVRGCYNLSKSMSGYVTVEIVSAVTP